VFTTLSHSAAAARQPSTTPRFAAVRTIGTRRWRSSGNARSSSARWRLPIRRPRSGPSTNLVPGPQRLVDDADRPQPLGARGVPGSLPLSPQMTMACGSSGKRGMRTFSPFKIRYRSSVSSPANQHAGARCAIAPPPHETLASRVAPARQGGRRRDS
jgi:hypothetical protein